MLQTHYETVSLWFDSVHYNSVSVNIMYEKLITVRTKYRKVIWWSENSLITSILLSCHNQIFLTTQIPWHFQASRNSRKVTTLNNCDDNTLFNLCFIVNPMPSRVYRQLSSTMFYVSKSFFALFNYDLQLCIVCTLVCYAAWYMNNHVHISNALSSCACVQKKQEDWGNLHSAGCQHISCT